MVRYCNHCGRTITDETQWCPHCGKQIGLDQGIRLPNQKKKSDKTVLIIVAVVIIALIVVFIAIPAAVYVYTSNMIGPDPVYNHTPSISLISNPSQDGTNCSITVGTITESNINWYETDLSLVDIYNSETITFQNSDWRPTGIISGGDTIIIENEDIIPDLKPNYRYRLTISYTKTGGTMGTVTWTQR